MAFCSKCGAQINDGAQFCPKCGQPSNAVSQQQVNQQQYVAQPQEKEHGRMYKMWHSKWNWIAAIVFLIIIVAANMGGGTSDIEKAVKDLMVNEFKKENSTLVIKDLTLVHKSGNEYTGIAECTVDGQPAQYALKVISDGQNVQAEWELSAIRDGGSDEVEEEESNVSNSIANDVAKQGYDDGYHMGFQLADVDMEPDAKISFTTNYGAPSTLEEKEMYNIYKQNYDKGYREGKRAGRE